MAAKTDQTSVNNDTELEKLKREREIKAIELDKLRIDFAKFAYAKAKEFLAPVNTVTNEWQLGAVKAATELVKSIEYFC